MNEIRLPTEDYSVVGRHGSHRVSRRPASAKRWHRSLECCVLSFEFAPDLDDDRRSVSTEGQIKERVRTEKKEPTLYKVVLLNDDYTTMEFVIQVLEAIFQKSPSEAYQIMMHVHVNGRGIAGVYPWELAETKAEQVISTAREAGYPLKAVTEEA